MDVVDDPPELSGYVPHEDRPLRGPLVMRIMRITIVLGVVGLVLPGLLGTIALQSRNADVLCEYEIASHRYPGQPDARFELLGPVGPGWYCYARAFDGREVLVRSLGLIPG